MAASLNILSLTPQTLSIHHSSSAAAAAAGSASSFFTPSSLKPLPKLVLSLFSIGNYANRNSRFVRNVAVSSDLEEDEGLDFSAAEEPNFSPDLKLFVGNLPFNVDSSGLAGLFEQAGNVEMVEVIYDKITGSSRGFGFVTMSTIEEVEAAAQQFNGYELQGRVLRVNSGPPPSKRENSSFREPPSGAASFDRENSPPSKRENSSFRGPHRGWASFDRENSSFRGPPRGGASFDSSNRVYVGNLAWGVDNLTLETLFGEQGNVKEATVVYDRESGRSRGFGFVTYSSSQEVNRAIQSLDGMDVNGRSIRVSRAEARPRRDY